MAKRREMSRELVCLRLFSFMLYERREGGSDRGQVRVTLG